MSRSAEKHLTGYRSVFEAFAERTSEWPARTALVGDGGRGCSYTYNDLLTLSKNLAGGIVQRGWIDNNGLGLIGENRPEWSLAYLAIMAAGGTVVPLDANLTEPEIEHLISHSGVKTVFCSAKFKDFLTGLNDNLNVISLEDDDENSWRHLASKSHDESAVAPNDVAVLIYTSGTTGDPKAVELTHANLLANLEGIRRAVPFDSEEVFLSVLPLHHTFEATVGLLTPLMAGLKVVYARSLKSNILIEDIAHNRATVLVAVPLLYEKMCSSFRRKIAAAPWPRRTLAGLLIALSSFGMKLGFRWGRVLLAGLRQKARLDSLELMVSGGAPLPESIARFFSALGFDFIQGYGLTETSPVVAVNRRHDRVGGSVGAPLGNVEVRIDQPEPSGIGEILVRGDNVTRGYRDNEEQTRALLRDGWLHTGDLGRMRDGKLWITGRAKNLIVSAAGKNIYPEELEEHLCASDLITEAVVFGRLRENRQGEEVHALIVPDLEVARELPEWTSDAAGNPEKLHQLMQPTVRDVNDRVARYKRIVRFSVQTDELEKTSTRKIKRFRYS
jgi:long-chain acyl-CoA synthetase